MSNPDSIIDENQDDRLEDDAAEEPREEQKQIAEKLKSLRNERQKIFTQVERLKSTIHRGTFGSVFALQLQFNKVSQAYDKYDTIQSQIESYKTEEDAEDFRTSFENLYYDTLGQTMDLINRLNPPPTQQVAAGHHVHRPMMEPDGKPVLSDQIHVTLPPLQLPFFDGDFKQWLMFKDAFDTTAWKLLIDSYEDHNHLVNLHLKAIFDISPITKATHTNRRHLVDTLNAHTRSLEKLQGPIDTWGNMILTHVIQSKLDFITKRDWDRAQEANRLQHSATYNEFIAFINKRSRTLMREDPEKASKPQPKQRVEQSRKLSLTTTVGSCQVCKENHKIYSCAQFLVI